MNVAEVRQLADRLGHAAEGLRAIVGTIDGRISHTSWHGPDAERFRYWWPGHRQLVLAAADHLQGLGHSARNNADEQERASGAAGSSSAGSGFVGSAFVGGSGWQQAAGAALGVAAGLAGRALDLGGQFVRGLDGMYSPIGSALGFTDIADWKILRDPNLPISRLFSDLAGDSAVKFIGGGLTGISVAAGLYDVYQDFQRGDVFEGVLDGIDTAADPFKTKSPVSYLAVVGIETYTDVARAAREVDWTPPWETTYGQYMNPFVAKNWTETILPGAADGLKQGWSMTLENLLP
jgi:hypothetical protein